MKVSDQAIHCFIVSVNQFEKAHPEIDMSGYTIHDWSLADELPEDAIKFCNFARAEGLVVSITGLMDEYNIEESLGGDDWLFITNLYKNEYYGNPKSRGSN